MTGLVRQVDQETEDRIRVFIGLDANKGVDVLSATVSVLADLIGPKALSEGLYRIADNLVACDDQG